MKAANSRLEAEQCDVEFLSALEQILSEWNSESDDKAYDGL